MPRRLPIFIVEDTSGSMYGEPIQSVNVGLQTMVSALCQDPHALDSVSLSIITFDIDVKEIFPLTPLEQVHIPVSLEKVSNIVEESYFEWSGSSEDINPKVSITSLHRSVSCPQYGNSIAKGFCGCGKMFCIAESGPAKCPWYGQVALMELVEGNNDFKIVRSRG